MNRLSVLIERLRGGGRRPPTGPLTAAEQNTAEQVAAEQSRQAPQAEDDEGAEDEQDEKLTP
jgi:hypothetical protein